MKCIICHSHTRAGNGSFEFQCISCGHMWRSVLENKTKMINEPLTSDVTRAPSRLSLWQSKVAINQRLEDKVLIDIGSGSGAFLHLVSSNFLKVYGVEVSEACIDFSKNELGLNVNSFFPNIQESLNQISVVTFWHSLEHIDYSNIKDLMKLILANSSSNTVIILSVPNGGSFFGNRLLKYFAFNDVYEHIHQFTYKSLNLMLINNGFIIQKVIPSVQYSSFAIIQSISNIFSPIHNYLYYRLKRKSLSSNKSSPIIDLYHLILAGISGVISVPFVIFELLYPYNASALTVIAKPQNS